MVIKPATKPVAVEPGGAHVAAAKAATTHVATAESATTRVAASASSHAAATTGVREGRDREQ
jgi:hypothetical protein